MARQPARDPGAATGEWTLTIPAPARWLNANSRADRRGWSGGVKTWRATAHTYARQARLPKLRRAHILAELRFADNRRRDAHNFYPTLKAVIDGLVDYGLLPDDSTEFLDGPDLRIGAVVPKRPGRFDGDVVLTIREVGVVRRGTRQPGSMP